MEILDLSFSSIESNVVPKITEQPYTDPGPQATKPF